MKVLGTFFLGQSFVQKTLLHFGYFYGQIWLFSTLMSIFIHQTGVTFVTIWLQVGHRCEIIKNIWISTCPPKLANAHHKMWTTFFAMSLGHNIPGTMGKISIHFGWNSDKMLQKWVNFKKIGFLLSPWLPSSTWT